MKQLNSLFLIGAMVLAILPAMAARTTVYKWTDETGQTIYSQTPPPPGIKGAEIIKGPPSPATSSEEAQQKTKEKAAGFDERLSEQQNAAADKQKIQQAEQQRKEYCNEMRKNLEVLTTRPLVRRANEKGEEVILTAEEKEADANNIREQLKKNCQS